jgi:hypothetical protein
LEDPLPSSTERLRISGKNGSEFPEPTPAIEGVTVERYMAPDRPPAPQPSEPGKPDQSTVDVRVQMRSAERAQALVDFLTNSDWEGVRVGWSQHGEICEDCIKVVVGLKPSPYAFAYLPWQMPEDARKAMEETEKMSRARDEERKRECREHNPPLPVRKN